MVPGQIRPPQCFEGNLLPRSAGSRLFWGLGFGVGGVGCVFEDVGFNV